MAYFLGNPVQYRENLSDNFLTVYTLSRKNAVVSLVYSFPHFHVTWLIFKALDR